MIAGETQLLFNQYPGPEDHFLGLKKKERERPELSEPARNQRGREVLKKVGNVVHSMGGFEGIGRKVDQIGGLISRRDFDPDAVAGVTPGREIDPERFRKEAEEEQKKKKKNQVLVWRIIGFSTLAILLGLAAYSILTSDPKPATV